MIHIHSDKSMKEATAELARIGIVGNFYGSNGSGEGPLLLAHDNADHRSMLADSIRETSCVLMPDVTSTKPLSPEHAAVMAKHGLTIESQHTFADALRMLKRPGPFDPDNF